MPIGERFVLVLLGSRSQGATVGLSYESEPWLLELDRLLLDRAAEVVEAAGGDLLGEDGSRPYPPEHWWWYLDEIVSGKRARPEGL